MRTRDVRARAGSRAVALRVETPGVRAGSGGWPRGL